MPVKVVEEATTPPTPNPPFFKPSNPHQSPVDSSFLDLAGSENEGHLINCSDSHVHAHHSILKMEGSDACFLEIQSSNVNLGQNCKTIVVGTGLTLKATDCYFLTVQSDNGWFDLNNAGCMTWNGNEGNGAFRSSYWVTVKGNRNQVDSETTLDLIVEGDFNQVTAFRSKDLTVSGNGNRVTVKDVAEEGLSHQLRKSEDPFKNVLELKGVVRDRVEESMLGMVTKLEYVDRVEIAMDEYTAGIFRFRVHRSENFENGAEVRLLNIEELDPGSLELSEQEDNKSVTISGMKDGKKEELLVKGRMVQLDGDEDEDFRLIVFYAL